ncbi:hypothetical protein [Phenylobacterium sp.]|uniref:hypothetical protein n=1 Tax=Phenylobacterium sp. TaxID=1871053 RepID=UPI003563A06C
MRFVEVARFTDLTEPQVAASALRASGIPVILQRDLVIQVHVNLIYAIGGPGLLVPEEDAEAARAFLNEVRTQPSTLAPLGSVEATLRLILSLALTWLTGFIVPLRPRRFERLGDGPAL